MQERVRKAGGVPIFILLLNDETGIRFLFIFLLIF